MTVYSKYLIHHTASIRDALIALNNLSSEVLTLFVINDMGVMLGTLTDGDIRRKLILNCSLDDVVTVGMNTSFHYININNEKIDVRKVRELRNNGITLLPLLDEQQKVKYIYNLKNFKSILPLDAVLMAGGKGERLRPLTEKTPKPLLPIGEKAIIDYNVDSLIKYGISQIHVTVNYLKEQLEAHFSKPVSGVQIKCVQEPCFLGTIGSIKFIDPFHNDIVLVMNSDLFTNINYEEFFLHFEENNADMSVAAVPYSVSIPYGIFDLNGRNIQGIKEKPSYNYYANAGIYLIKKDLLNLIPSNAFFNATDFIDLLISENYKVIRFPLTGYWIDIGKQEDYNKARELVKHIK
jgi:dTDP-glucose pyrophosphorylase